MVDTSVWVNYFRQRHSSQIELLDQMLQKRGTVLLGDLILTEILQGVKSKQESVVIEDQFHPLTVREMVGESIARQSAEYVRQLRSQGITVRKTIDCLIASWCIKNKVPLLHADRDFEHFKQFGLLEVDE